MRETTQEEREHLKRIYIPVHVIGIKNDLNEPDLQTVRVHLNANERPDVLHAFWKLRRGGSGGMTSEMICAYGDRDEIGLWTKVTSQDPACEFVFYLPWVGFERFFDLIVERGYFWALLAPVGETFNAVSIPVIADELRGVIEEWQTIPP